MKVYESLRPELRAAIEKALDDLAEECAGHGVMLTNDDRAARAAEALAVYLKESQA